MRHRWWRPVGGSVSPLYAAWREHATGAHGVARPTLHGHWFWGSMRAITFRGVLAAKGSLVAWVLCYRDTPLARATGCASDAQRPGAACKASAADARPPGTSCHDEVLAFKPERLRREFEARQQI